MNSTEQKIIDLEEKVIKLIADTAKISRDTITHESRFVQDLKLDSLDLVEFMMAVETEFNCSIPDEEASKILTVQDVVNYIQVSSGAAPIAN